MTASAVVLGIGRSCTLVARPLEVVGRLALECGGKRHEQRLAERRTDELKPDRQAIGAKPTRKEDRRKSREIAGGDQPKVSRPLCRCGRGSHGGGRRIEPL